MQVLQLRSPARLLSSFNRPNISYAVRYQLAGSKPPVDQIAQLIGAGMWVGGSIVRDYDVFAVRRAVPCPNRSRVLVICVVHSG